MKINGAIFDMDGTLLDSMFVWDNIAENYLRMRGIMPRPDLKAVFNRLTIAQSADYYRREYGILDSTEQIVSEINHMIEHYYFEEVLPREGVEELLKTLSERGVRMCVATATDRYLTEAALKRCRLFDYFCGVFTCTEAGTGKSEPFIFEQARELLGTSHDVTFVFEDSLYAATTAKQAGFRVAGIRDDSESKQDELRQIADYYLDSMKDFQKYLGDE